MLTLDSSEWSTLNDVLGSEAGIHDSDSIPFVGNHTGETDGSRLKTSTIGEVKGVVTEGLDQRGGFAWSRQVCQLQAWRRHTCT